MSLSFAEAIRLCDDDLTCVSDDDLVHVVCEVCRRQFCDGALDLAELDEAGDSDDDCIVCDHLDSWETAPNLCPHCGSP